MGRIRGIHYEKSRRDFVARAFALIAPVHPVLYQLSCNYETIPNAPKNYETHQNMSLGSNGVDQVRSLPKIQCDFVAQTFVLIETVQYVFATSLMQLRNDPKCTQILQNGPKH